MVNKGLEAASLVTRVAAVVFGIIALALVVSELREKKFKFAGLAGEIKCVLSKKSSEEERCDLVLGAGALSLIIGVLFAIVNILALVLNAALALVVFAGGRRGVLAIIDLILAIILAIIWFAAGIYVASDWKDARKNYSGDPKKSGDATVVFCFISFAAWVVVAIFAGVIRAKGSSVVPGTA